MLLSRGLLITVQEEDLNADTQRQADVVKYFNKAAVNRLIGWQGEQVGRQEPRNREKHASCRNTRKTHQN